jgi:hypothetical protein
VLGDSLLLMAPLSGRRDEYAKVRSIGAGGSILVESWKEKRTGRLIVVKTFLNPTPRDSERIYDEARFLTEMMIRDAFVHSA